MKNKEEVDPYYFNILEELNDFNEWCISDNTKWGIPIPCFKYKDSDKLVIDPQIVTHFAKLVEKHGTSEIWYTMEVKDLLPKKYLEDSDQLEKCFQVFDSWFDSSLSWNFALFENDVHKNSPLYDQMKTLVQPQG